VAYNIESSKFLSVFCLFSIYVANKNKQKINKKINNTTMKEEFVAKHFLVRKFLRKMAVGDRKYVPNGKCSYNNLKATAHQLKQFGEGVWRVSKKTDACQIGSGGSWVTREQ
jgi:CRISPR/Cas system-associated protein endoribonuclease Cas2